MSVVWSGKGSALSAESVTVGSQNRSQRTGPRSGLLPVRGFASLAAGCGIDAAVSEKERIGVIRLRYAYDGAEPSDFMLFHTLCTVCVRVGG